jgi:hypothetical protein
MASTYTANTGLALPAFNDGAWNATLNGNLTLLDGMTAIGGLAVQLKEVPSASLNVAVSAGTYRKADGTLATYAGTASRTLTASATNYLWLTDVGVLTLSTSAFPTTGNVVRLATATTNATTVTGITDARIPWLSLGGHVNWGVGTPTIAAGAGAGTTPTLTVTGSDQGGLITIATGTAPTASAVVATITFGQAFPTAPRAVILTPGGSSTAALSGAAQVYVEVTAISTTAFTITVGSTNLTASTTYKWQYAVIG